MILDNNLPAAKQELKHMNSLRQINTFTALYLRLSTIY